MEEVEKKQAEEAKARREAKKAAKKSQEKPAAEEPKEKVEQAEKVEKKVEEQVEEKPTKKKTTKKEAAKESKPKKTRGKKYQKVAKSVDVKKKYKLEEALKLLKKVKYARFDETVELHINLLNPGLKGQVSLPHGTGKTIKAVVATDEVLSEIESGKINFDVLIAHPSFMPKLVKHARTLGPKGLMPNPKNETVSENPEEAAKKLALGATNYKSEAKFPLIHLSVGKASFTDKDLAENVRAYVDSITKKNIKSIFLKSTMSPGIQIEVESL